MLNSEMGIAATVPIEAVEQEGQREMQDLLEQLKTEPTVVSSPTCLAAVTKCAATAGSTGTTCKVVVHSAHYAETRSF